MKFIIFNHRRDLRIADNIALYKSITQDKNNIVIPAFFFDPHQIVKNSHNKNYFSEKAAFFVIASVIDLKKQYQDIGSNLLVLYDKPHICLELIIKTILKMHPDETIIYSYNLDYSKYSVERDTSNNNVANHHSTEIINDDDMSDYCLIPWSKMLKDADNKIAYKQYGAFYKNAIKTAVEKPLEYKKYYKQFISSKHFSQMFKDIEYTDLESLMSPSLLNSDSKEQWNTAGLANCLARLKQSKLTHLKTYNTDRDMLSYDTSNISAYLNIGTISVRQIYYIFLKSLKSKTQLLKQLFWRDFYLCALRFLPDGNEYHHMDNRYDVIKWSSSSQKSSKKYKLMDEEWKKMMDSKTGFLLIDAGMRQLKETGFLHGRLRMILGTFWTKYLLINIFDPKYGSQVGYSKYLVDAIGPSQNKLNHQWITEFDMPGKKYSAKNAPLSGRPMNISNIQIKKFDKDCIYIKKWIPHLENVLNKDIYKWSEEIAEKYGNIHPGPIFDPKERYNEWIKICTI